MKRIQRTFVLCAIALTFFMLGTSQSSAGIVLDSNGIVTSFTPGGTDPTIYFYQGSYNDNQTVITHFDNANSEIFADKLAEELNNYSGAPAASVIGNYWFVFAADANTFMGAFTSPSQLVAPFTWTSNDPREYSRDYAGNRFANYYMASTINPSGGGVPEPSTAIAMALLGVVGFAGNRRRRRQS